MEDFRLEQTGNVAVLALNGPVTVDRACELKGKLITAFYGAEHIILDFGGVTEVDLSCLQILCSAHRTLTKLNKNITLGNIQPDVFSRAVECAGFNRHTGCALDAAKSCLWVVETKNNPPSVQHP